MFWYQVDNYPKYEMTMSGEVRWIDTGRDKKQSSSQSYPAVSLTNDAGTDTIMVHRLVAMNFLPNPDNLPCVDHIDNNKLNNHISNLRWCTNQDNTQSYYTNFGNKFEIYQLDMDDNLIKKWDSFDDILKENPEYRRDSIRNNLNGHRLSAYWYKWAYVIPRVIKPPKVAPPGEVFTPIKKFKGSDLSQYSISGKGFIQNADGLILSDNVNGRGYNCLNLINQKTGKEKKYCTHRLVAFTYVENDDPETKIYVNHMDGNKLNNSSDNLEWCTQLHNAVHALGIKVKMIDIETNITIQIFDCLNAIPEFLDIPPGAVNTISRICHGTRKSNIAYGYKWKPVK